MKHVRNFQRILVLMVYLAISIPLSAQTITIKGMVKESVSKEPIIGANVAIKGTTLGTISDIDGAYTIQDVDSKGILVISYIGYGNNIHCAR